MKKTIKFSSGGPPDGFSDFYQQNAPRLRRWVVSKFKISRDIADELVDDAFIHLLEKEEPKNYLNMGYFYEMLPYRVMSYGRSDRLCFPGDDLPDCPTPTHLRQRAMTLEQEFAYVWALFDDAPVEHPARWVFFLHANSFKIREIIEVTSKMGLNAPKSASSIQRLVHLTRLVLANHINGRK